jgi:hypothetical protein
MIATHLADEAVTTAARLLVERSAVVEKIARRIRARASPSAGLALNAATLCELLKEPG